MSEALSPTSIEEEEARSLAEQVGLEYREPSAVAIDPRALSILPASECRRLRAVPLAGTVGSPVVAVSDPNAERLDAVRELTGSSTRFVVLSDKTIDALLRSRMFTNGSEAASLEDESPAEPMQYEEHQPEPEYEPEAEPEYQSDQWVEDEPTADTEPEYQPETQPEPEPELESEQLEPHLAPAAPGPVAAVDSGLVDAIVKALEPKLRTVNLQATQGDATTDSIWDPVARVDATIEAWSNLRAALETIGEELDQSRQSLREVKEQLSAAHAVNDQHQRRIDALEAELAERKSLFDEARTRLQDAARALGARELDISDDLL
jgi:type II secretion system (T2SS) protein E